MGNSLIDIFPFKLAVRQVVSYHAEMKEGKGGPTTSAKAQYADRILNKITKTFDQTYLGLKSMLQRFRKYFFKNPRSKGTESTR